MLRRRYNCIDFHTVLLIVNAIDCGLAREPQRSRVEPPLLALIKSP